MDLESAKKVPLNRITHSVRASQAVLQYGVGAMIDFPNQTFDDCCSGILAGAGCPNT